MFEQLHLTTFIKYNGTVLEVIVFWFMLQRLSGRRIFTRYHLHFRDFYILVFHVTLRFEIHKLEDYMVLSRYFILIFILLIYNIFAMVCICSGELSSFLVWISFLKVLAFSSILLYILLCTVVVFSAIPTSNFSYF